MVVGNGVGDNWTREEKKLDHVENPRRRTRGQLRVRGVKPPQRPWGGVWGGSGFG